MKQKTKFWKIEPCTFKHMVQIKTKAVFFFFFFFFVWLIRCHIGYLPLSVFISTLANGSRLSKCVWHFDNVTWIWSNAFVWSELHYIRQSSTWHLFLVCNQIQVVRYFLFVFRISSTIQLLQHLRSVTYFLSWKYAIHANQQIFLLYLSEDCAWIKYLSFYLLVNRSGKLPHQPAWLFCSITHI